MNKKENIEYVIFFALVIVQLVCIGRLNKSLGADQIKIFYTAYENDIKLYFKLTHFDQLEDHSRELRYRRDPFYLNKLDSSKLTY